MTLSAEQQMQVIRDLLALGKKNGPKRLTPELLFCRVLWT